jgi:hypothetical protein
MKPAKSQIMIVGKARLKLAAGSLSVTREADCKGWQEQLESFKPTGYLSGYLVEDSTTLSLFFGFVDCLLSWIAG